MLKLSDMMPWNTAAKEEEEEKRPPVLRIKEGVRLDGLQPVTVLGIQVAASVYFSFGHDCIVTCGTEGEHMADSKHHCGRAFDLRIRHLPEGLVPQVAQALQMALDPRGRQWEVVVESTHIHVEHNPL